MAPPPCVCRLSGWLAYYEASARVSQCAYSDSLTDAQASGIISTLLQDTATSTDRLRRYVLYHGDTVMTRWNKLGRDKRKSAVEVAASYVSEDTSYLFWC